ncbi:MAG: Nif11 family protein [Tatlockia sp.]|nr:Nif11 family protein [Tatlockia sp.]
MVENIKFYPKSYQMSEELKLFFTAITNDLKLQDELSGTNKLSDVVKIASKLGFNLKNAEVLQAQAGRVLAILDEQSEDVNKLLSGLKPQTGAQWGRGGGGFLDKAGFWLNELSTPTALTAVEAEINQFLKVVNQDQALKEKLISCNSFNALADLVQAHNIQLNAIDLLTHQAQKILSMCEEDADRVADN